MMSLGAISFIRIGYQEGRSLMSHGLDIGDGVGLHNVWRHGQATKCLRWEAVQWHKTLLVEHVREDCKPQQAITIDMGGILDPFKEEVMFS